MIKARQLTVLFFVTACFSAFVNAENPEVVNEGSGIYRSKIEGIHSYKVDTVTELCFAGGYSGAKAIVQIDCNSLAKRPEWKSVITWIKTT